MTNTNDLDVISPFPACPRCVGAKAAVVDDPAGRDAADYPSEPGRRRNRDVR